MKIKGWIKFFGIGLAIVLVIYLGLRIKSLAGAEKRAIYWQGQAGAVLAELDASKITVTELKRDFEKERELYEEAIAKVNGEATSANSVIADLEGKREEQDKKIENMKAEGASAEQLIKQYEVRIDLDDKEFLRVEERDKAKDKLLAIKDGRIAALETQNGELLNQIVLRDKAIVVLKNETKELARANTWLGWQAKAFKIETVIAAIVGGYLLLKK